MSNNITLTGRLTAAPDLRFTPSGKAVATFTVVDDYGRKNRDTGQWEKEGSTFLRCEVWGTHAEQVAELNKGQRVVVVGEIRQRDYERNGEKRTAYEVKNVSEVGVLVDKWERRADGQGRQGGSKPPADDPWSSAPATGTGYDEPPF